MSEVKRRLKVFLCHASQDKPIVRELYRQLANEEWIDIWLDEVSLLPGQDWRLSIEKAVDLSDVVIVCLSSNSVNKDGFIQKELRYVKEVALEKPEGKIFLIPMRLDECDVPRGLRFYQWGDYFDKKKEAAGYALLQSLKWRYEQELTGGENVFQKEDELVKVINNKSTTLTNKKQDSISLPISDDSLNSLRNQEKVFFIGSRLHQNIPDVSNLIDVFFRSKNCTPYYADTNNANSQTVLLNVCQKIRLSDFAIFDISDANMDTFIEIGIALAFNKRMILTALSDSTIPSALKDCPIYFYGNHQELSGHLEEAFINVCLPRLELSDFCMYCNQKCTGFDIYPDRSVCLVLDKRGLLSFVEWANIRSVIDPLIQAGNLQPTSLKENVGERYLCNIRKKVKAAQFSVCHLGELTDETSLIALGMTIAYCRPWLLLKNEISESVVPSCLVGLDILEYTTLIDLGRNFESGLRDFLALFDPHAEVTSIISREPFWFVLSDWLETLKPARVTGALRKGGVRIVRVGHDSFLDKFNVTRKELIIGRDDSSDVVIRSNLVTTRHASLYEQDGEYYLKDLSSKNGTFYNGQRISSGTIVPINPSGIIRIAHVAEFLVWDESPLPVDSFFAQNRHITTAGYPHIILQDEKPLIGDEESDFTFSLAFKGKINRAYQVQSYYHLGKILGDLARRSNFVAEEYCVTLGAVPLDEESTILELKIPDGEVLEIVSFKEVVRKLLLKLYDVSDYSGPQKYVDFVMKRSIKGVDEVIFIYSAKSKLRTDHLDGLIYESIMHMRTYWLRKKDLLSSDIYELERKIEQLENNYSNVFRIKQIQPQDELRKLNRLIDLKKSNKSITEKAIHALEADAKDWSLLKKKQLVKDLLGTLSGEVSFPLINNIIVSAEKTYVPHHLKEMAEAKGVILIGLEKLNSLLDKAKENPIDVILNNNTRSL